MDTNIAPILQQGHCCFFFLWKLINMLPSKSLPSYWSRRSQLFPLLQFTMCSISSLIKYFEVWTWCLRQWRFHTMLCRISKSCIVNSVALHCIASEDFNLQWASFHKKHVSSKKNPIRLKILSAHKWKNQNCCLRPVLLIKSHIRVSAEMQHVKGI